MVYAFIIQNLTQESCDILFYRVYCAAENVLEKSSNNIHRDDENRGCKKVKLFDGPIEKREMLDNVAKSIQMHYYLRMSHISPSFDFSNDTFIQGMFMETLINNGNQISIRCPVIWQGGHNLAFALMCEIEDNIVQAQNILELIITQLEKHLQFVTNPALAMGYVETVGLVVNQYLPTNQLLFINSKESRLLEKQLESDLFAK